MYYWLFGICHQCRQTYFLSTVTCALVKLSLAQIKCDFCEIISSNFAHFRIYHFISNGTSCFISLHLTNENLILRINRFTNASLFFPIRHSNPSLEVYLNNSRILTDVMICPNNEQILIIHFTILNRPIDPYLLKS